MSALQRVRDGIVPGILGGTLAFLLSNLWFYYLTPASIQGSPGRQLMPEFLVFLVIDLYVGAGSGYAGGLTGPSIAGLLSLGDRPTWLLPALYALILGVGITLIVNVLLLFMFFL